MSISLLNTIKNIESRIPLMNAASLRSIREDIDAIGEYSSHIKMQLMDKFWEQARFQSLI